MENYLANQRIAIAIYCKEFSLQFSSGQITEVHSLLKQTYVVQTAVDVGWVISLKGGF